MSTIFSGRRSVMSIVASLAAFLTVAASAYAVPAHAQNAVVGNPDAGARKNSMCVGCHGIPEYKTAFPILYRVPKIAGQSEPYLVAALQAYKNGERNHASMRAVASTLTDQDMADLAAFYARVGKQ